MQSKLWSISGLAAELKMDRRTLAKRLEHLPPAEEKKTDKRTQKLWRLIDVVEHLKNPKQNNHEASCREATKEYLSEKLFPAIVDNPTFTGTLFHNAIEAGCTKQQALDQYKMAVHALAAAFFVLIDDDNIKIEMGTRFEFLIKHGDEEYIDNHWPKWR